MFESITHKEEIKTLLDEAQHTYDEATRKFENQKKATTNSLEKLGKIKVLSWSEGMDSFADAFGAFKNIEINRKSDLNMYFIGCDEEPKQMLINIENASLTANEVAKAGFAAIGTGALVGVAAYGGAMMFGSASTGTAIAALSGAAKTNATLAWFGGGAKAAGGLGMAGGKLVLAGIVILPILGIAAIIAGAKGKEKLAEAKKINAEAKNAASQMDVITTGMQGIESMSDNYSSFIKKFGKIFDPFINELTRIKNDYRVDEDGFVDFDRLTLVEQKTLHLSWLMAQVYYHVLSTPILTADGKVSQEAFSTISASNNEFKQIKKDTFKMTGEEAKIGNLVWHPVATKMMALNFVAMAILITCGVFAFSSSILKGILFIICSVIALPIFFKFTDLPDSKKYIWRLVRLIVAVIIAITIGILL